jgi:hypothetical protein
VYSVPAGRLIGLCSRCRSRYSDLAVCEPCLRTAQVDLAEKRGILLADHGLPDTLSALA